MRLILWLFAYVAAAAPTPAPTATPTCPDCDQTFKLFLTTDEFPGDTMLRVRPRAGRFVR